MKHTEILARLESHEIECNLRYQRIEERLNEQKDSLKSLDMKIWGIAVLVIIAPFSSLIIN
tara:strand:- start:507 stop:689 length:183 start_codon:yes stop_codon:yes gene_type:complete